MEKDQLSLLADIERLCRARDWSVSTFGTYATGNSHVVDRLARGAVGDRIKGRIRLFIAKQWAEIEKQVAPANGWHSTGPADGYARIYHCGRPRGKRALSAEPRSQGELAIEIQESAE